MENSNDEEDFGEIAVCILCQIFFRPQCCQKPSNFISVVSKLFKNGSFPYCKRDVRKVHQKEFREQMVGENKNVLQNFGFPYFLWRCPPLVAIDL